MLFQREPVGHSGDVVGHRANGVGPLRKGGRHLARLGAVGIEELGDHLLRAQGRRFDLRVAIEVVEQKLLQLAACFLHADAEAHHGRCGTHILDAGRPGVFDRRIGRGHDVVHLLGQHAPDRLEQHAPSHQVGELPAHRLDVSAEQRNLFELLDVDQARAHAIVHVVRVVGDLVGEVAELRLQAGLRPVEKTLRHAAGLGFTQPPRIALRAALQDAFARLEGQVQSVEGRIAFFQQIDNPQALVVVLEPAFQWIGQA